MALETFCANLACRRRFLLPDSSAGQSFRCPTCKGTFVAGSTASGEGTPARSGKIATDAIGSKLGRFIIRDRLGAGAFGTVYRAFDPILDRDVALKIPNATVLSDEKRIERFLREAKAAAGLRHPHIVAVFDAGKDGDRYYIAAAFIEGQSLADTIPEGGTDLHRAARLVRELAEALAYAHQQGIVHRDVKPQNIMVDQHDRSHLMDFGLATRQDEESKLTSDGTVMGTPAYMAPEQAIGQKGEPKPTVDQYSAGVVLYEMLTGRPPFAGPVPVVLHNVIHTAPDSPRKVRPDTPPDLETICLKAMAKRPEDRYPDCQAFADDLRRWMEGEPITARQLTPRERFTRWVRKEPKLAAAGGVIAVLLFLGVMLVLKTAVWARSEAKTQEGLRQQAEREAADAREAKRVAEEAEKRAEDAAAKAETARANGAWDAKRAMEEKQSADSQRMKAETQRKKADEAKQAAEAAQKRLENTLAELTKTQNELATNAYPTQIRLAKQLIDVKSFKEAEGVLDRCAPQARGAEWTHLKALCGKMPEGTPVQNHKLSDDELTAAAFSIDGRNIAFATTQRAISLHRLHMTLAGEKPWDVVGGLAPFPQSDGGAKEKSPIRFLCVSGVPEELSDTYLVVNQTICRCGSPLGEGRVRPIETSFGTIPHGSIPQESTPRNRGDLSFAAQYPDGQIRVYQYPFTIPQLSILLPRKHSVFTFSADGERLATSDGLFYRAVAPNLADVPKPDHDNFLNLFEKRYSLSDRARITTLALSRRGELLAFHERVTNGVYLYTPGQKDSFRELLGNWPGVTMLRFSRDGSRLAFVEGKYGPVQLADTRTGSVLLTFRPTASGAAPGSILDVGFHPDGHLMAITTSGRLHIWRGETPKLPEKN